MAISYVNHQTTLTDGGPVTKPTGTASGDLIIILAHHRQSSSTPPSGFTNSFVIQPVTQHRVYVHWKIAGGSEPANYSITNALSMIAISFRGVEQVLPANWVEADTSANTGTLNTTRDNSWLVDIAQNWNSGGAAVSHSTPSGYTARGTVTEAMPVSGGNYRVSLFVKETSTAIGGYSVSNTSGTGNNGSALIEIREPFVRPKGPDFFPFF